MFASFISNVKNLIRNSAVPEPAAVQYVKVIRGNLVGGISSGQTGFLGEQNNTCHSF